MTRIYFSSFELIWLVAITLWAIACMFMSCARYSQPTVHWLRSLFRDMTCITPETESMTHLFGDLMVLHTKFGCNMHVWYCVRAAMLANGRVWINKFGNFVWEITPSWPQIIKSLQCFSPSLLYFFIGKWFAPHPIFLGRNVCCMWPR